ILSSNDPLSPMVSVSLTGTATSPAISVDHPSVSFGQVVVGQTSTPAVTLTIHNGGTGPLTVTSIAITGANADQFAETGQPSSFTIAPSGDAALSLTFSPTAVGHRVAHLVISSDAGAPVDVPLDGDGGSPSIALDPTSLDFGTQLVGRASTARTFDIQNT